MVIGSNMIYRNPMTGDFYPLRSCPFTTSDLEEGYWYEIGNFVYPYLGKMESSVQFKRDCEGGIAIINGEIVFKEWVSDELKERHSTMYVMEKDRVDTLEDQYRNRDYEGILKGYKETYDQGNNLAVRIKKRRKVTGDYYKPELCESDYPLDRLTKLMVRSMKIVSSEKRNAMDKEYSFDNLVSTLGNGTLHMSIVKYLEWASLLGWTWEFTVFNLGDDVAYPLKGTITITDTDDGWKDIEESVTKEVFKAPLVRDGKVKGKNIPFDPDNPYRFEDPFKRLIKLALDSKSVPTNVYRKRGDSPHLINNMKSALKSSQKMTSRYFIIWCEILDMGYSLKITNKDGIWFKTVGYDVTTNYIDDTVGADV